MELFIVLLNGYSLNLISDFTLLCSSAYLRYLGLPGGTSDGIKALVIIAKTQLDYTAHQ